MRFILASASPRRSELLRMLGMTFETIPSQVEEKSTDIENPRQIVMALSFEKAYDIAIKHPDAIVIGSDTIVYQEKMLGKPIDKNEAREMLKHLSGRIHEVYTGLAVICIDNGVKRVEYVKTDVRFKNLTDEEIDAYINSKEPMDKAGAYGIQGIGALLVEDISGDYFSVMGLPLSKLNRIMVEEFNENLLTKER